MKSCNIGSESKKAMKTSNVANQIFDYFKKYPIVSGNNKQDWLDDIDIILQTTKEDSNEDKRPTCDCSKTIYRLRGELAEMEALKNKIERASIADDFISCFAVMIPKENGLGNYKVFTDESECEDYYDKIRLQHPDLGGVCWGDFRGSVKIASFVSKNKITYTGKDDSFVSTNLDDLDSVDLESTVPPENKGDWIVYFRTARDDGKVEAFWEYFETEKEALENQAEVRPAIEKHVTIKAEYCGLKKDCKELMIK